MASYGDHVIFTMQFLQMCEDFQAIIRENECPACTLQTRIDTVCQNEECDWMLFVAPNKLHPATIPWVNSLQERLS